jgi:large subunit ribosomal protein L33
VRESAREGKWKIMREKIVLECTECGDRNYITTLDTRGGKKVEVMKYCPRLRKRTLHKSKKI